MKNLFAISLAIFTIHASLAQRNIATISDITATQALDGKVFFTATHEQYGAELHVSNGNSGNFEVVKDISPGYAGSNPNNFIVFNNELFFLAYSPKHGNSLWKSDGTAEGTKLVYGVENAEPFNLMIFKGKLYFTTALGSIMRTDGTAEGTALFYQAEFTWGRINTIVKHDDYMYFTPDGRTIYRDDGTSRINFLGPLSWEDVYFKKLFVIENMLVAIKSSTYDNMIRVYSLSEEVMGDDQEDEWVLIKKLDAPVYGDQEIDNFTIVSGKLFFSFRTDYDNVPPTDELWVCDGTEAGTKMVKSFPWEPYYYQSEMGMFFTFKGKLFFRAGSVNNQALWTSDGTTEGTSKFHDVIITPPYNDERLPVLVDEDKFYFSGNSNYSTELWVSDGTTAGTNQLLDLEDDGGSIPHLFSVSNDVVYFVTSEQYTTTLWSSKPAADISLGGYYSFYGVPIGGCKTSEVVILNKGLKELYLGSIFITGNDFYLVQQSVPEKIAPGESISIQIVFNPVKEGTAQATLTILSNDLNEAKYIVNLGASPDAFAPSKICPFPSGEYVKSLAPGDISKPIALTNSSIAELQPKGTVIGELSYPQSGSNVTYTLVVGEGDDDNQHFIIDGNILKSNTIFNFNLRSLYSLRAKAVSENGEAETSFRISVNNATLDYVDGICRQTFAPMSFTYKSLEANSQGHLFATTNNGRILRSIDAGLNWEAVYSGYYSTLSGITFKGNTGWASGPQVLLKSDDGGATWFQIYLPLSGEYYFGDLHAFFLSETTGYVCTEEGEIFFTEDGGRTWETRLKNSWYEFREMFFFSEDKGYATSGWGDLVKTDDGGRTWLTVDLSNLGWSTRVKDIWFVNDKDGFICAEYNFYKTTNGGESWVEVPDIAGGEMSKIKFYDENVGFLYDGYSGLYKTTNGGQTWTRLFPDTSHGTVNGVALVSGKIFITGENPYYGYEVARSFAVSSDEGATWSAYDYFSDGNLYDIDFSPGGTGIVNGENGLFKTDDHGQTWKKAPTDIAVVGDVHFIDDNTVILQSGGHLYKSTDGGATSRNVLTTEQGENHLPAGTLYGFPGNILFSVSWYAVYRSDDLGETWELVSTNPGYYTQGMHFISSSIGYRVELFGSVEKTTDGGRTWSEIFTRDPGASDVFNSIFFVNETIGYSGGDHLQRTNDGGVSWEKIDYPFYEIIGIHFENENHGYVVTRGGTVYETSNAGLTWQSIFVTSTRVSRVEFVNDEIYMIGEHGFIASSNSLPAPPSQPGYINGPDRVCAGDAAEFHVSVYGNYSTQWSTSVGSAEDYNGYVTVKFPDPGEYTISAKHFNSCGVSAVRTTTVLVSAPPGPVVIDGPGSIPMEEQDVSYTIVDGNGDSRFLWEVQGGSGIEPVENGVIIDWSDSEEGVIKVLEVDASGCRAYGTMTVKLEQPLAAESDLGNHVSIYPNPTEANTQIASAHTGLLFVRIIDVVGREYSRMILSGGEDRTLATKQLPVGLYLIEISDGMRTVTKKLIRK